MMGGWGYGPGYYGMHGYWGGWLGIALQALFWIVVLVLVFYLFRRSRPHGSTSPMNTLGPSRAMEILKERYARGEISAEEFQQRKRDLE